MEKPRYASREEARYALYDFRRVVAALPKPWPPGLALPVMRVEEFLALAEPALPSAESCRRSARRKRVKR